MPKRRSLENAGKRERANAAKAANARERNIAKNYLNQEIDLALFLVIIIM